MARGGCEGRPCREGRPGGSVSGAAARVFFLRLVAADDEGGLGATGPRLSLGAVAAAAETKAVTFPLKRFPLQRVFVGIF